MPRSIIPRRIDREKYLSAMLQVALEASGYTEEKLAARFGIQPRSMRNRLKKPYTMSAGDLFKLCDMVGLNIEIYFKLEERG